MVTTSTLTLELTPSVEQYDITTVGELLAVSALNVTFIAALVLTLLAVTVHAHTRGSTSFAQRLTR